MLFVYCDDNLVLKNINFFVFLCNFVVLVGYIGSGKSIFVSLLMGYYLLMEGEICFDGCLLSLLSYSVLC